MTIDEFISDHEEARAIFDRVHSTIQEIGPAELRVTKSQVAFRRRINFAYVWMPDAYLRNAKVPAVLTVGLRRKDNSTRWKEIVEPVPGRFTHHLELRSTGDVDEAVRAWLKEAWDAAA